MLRRPLAWSRVSERKTKCYATPAEFGMLAQIWVSSDRKAKNANSPAPIVCECLTMARFVTVMALILSRGIRWRGIGYGLGEEASKSRDYAVWVRFFEYKPSSLVSRLLYANDDRSIKSNVTDWTINGGVRSVFNRRCNAPSFLRR